MKYFTRVMRYCDLACFSKIPPWLYLVILGFITFCAHPINVAADLKGYICYALNIYMGEGYVDIDGSLVFFRGPLFPLMIALSYWFFGVSHESTFWVIKICCILNPIVIYAIGKRFFGERVGFLAALLVLTSYTINYWSYRHLDAVWPFFVLLSTLSFYLGYEENKSRYFVLAGISLALAYLVKEVAILFFPLPFLMFFLIKDYRKKFFLRKVLLGYTATFIVILLWLSYLLLHNHSLGLNLILGRAGSGVLGSLNLSGLGDVQNLLPVIFGKLKSWVIGLCHYYHGAGFSLDRWFFIAPLFIIAWCFILLGAIRGNKHHRILILLVILFVPIMYIQGTNNMRIGQTLIVFLLSYLALVTFIDSLFNMVSRRWIKVSKVMPSIFIATIVCLIIVQIFVSFRKDFGDKEFLKKNPWYQLVFADKNHEAITASKGVLSEDRTFLNTIKNLSTPPNKLYVAGTKANLAREIYFNLKGRNTIYLLHSQIIKCLTGEKLPYPGEQPIYFKVFRTTAPRAPSFIAVYESQVFEMIQKEDITHVLVESFDRGLDRYFSTSRGFKRIPTPFDGCSIYKVIPDVMTPLSLPPIMDIETLRAFLKLSTEKSGRNLSFVKRCFKTLFPSIKCEEPENNSPYFERTSGAMKHEASLLNDTGSTYAKNGAYEQSIDYFRQAICMNPDLAEAYNNLFWAYGFVERQKAISLNPESPISYYDFAICLQEGGRIEAAIVNFKKCIRLDLNYTDAYVKLGYLYAKQKRHYEAIEAFQQAARVYKESIVPGKDEKLFKFYCMIGDSYREIGSPVEARRYYERAVCVSCSDLVGYYNLGILYLRLNNYQKAIENLKQAVRIEPKHAEAYYYLCLSHLLIGNKETALTQYKKLKEIDLLFANKILEMDLL